MVHVTTKLLNPKEAFVELVFELILLNLIILFILVHNTFTMHTSVLTLDIDECAIITDACNNNGICTNRDGNYQCQCNTGYVGDRCDRLGM